MDSSEERRTVCNSMSIDDFDIDNSIDEVSIDFSELTRNVKIHKCGEFGDHDWIVTGEGMFDDLMEVVTKHLKAQFEANRIREEDYAVAYTDLFKTTLAQITEAWLKKAEIEAQAKLIAMQAKEAAIQILALPYTMKKTAAETEYICEQTIHERIKERLTEIQIEKVRAEIEHIHAQTTLVLNQAAHELSKKANTEATTILIGEQTEHEKLKEANIQAATNEINIKVDELIPAQARLYDCQANKECRQVDLVDPQIQVFECQAQLYCSQANKTDADKEESKAKSLLYYRQIESFDEKYKTDILKIMADAWNVGFSVSKDDFSASDGFPIIMQTRDINEFFTRYVEADLDNYVYGRRKPDWDSTENLPPRE